jgi:hypothetical protein
LLNPRLQVVRHKGVLASSPVPTMETTLSFTKE